MPLTCHVPCGPIRIRCYGDLLMAAVVAVCIGTKRLKKKHADTEELHLGGSTSPMINDSVGE